MPELESHKAEQNLGLGLVGACKIVELHGGVMDIRNDESGGAVIAITLPKTRKEL